LAVSNNTSFQELDVWRTGIELAKQVYELTRTFPADESRGLSQQMQTAAISVPSNIAEAHIRSSIFHLSAARGSLASVETMLAIAQELKYCTPTSPPAVELVGLCRHVTEKINVLQRRLNDRGGSSA
jgi:four helix bundle protein